MGVINSASHVRMNSRNTREEVQGHTQKLRHYKLAPVVHQWCLGRKAWKCGWWWGLPFMNWESILSRKLETSKKTNAY